MTNRERADNPCVQPHRRSHMHASGVEMNTVDLTATYDEDRVIRRRAIVATVLGNGFEWFDFMVYGFFAITIAKLFFPTGNDLSSLMLSVATFGVGFLVRPFGGILIGIYADRAGRKAALSLTILLMCAGTALIGLAQLLADWRRRALPDCDCTA